MTTLVAIIVVIVLTLAATTVFYAWHRPGPLVAKTAIAAVGFLVLFLTLWLTGVHL